MSKRIALPLLALLLALPVAARAEEDATPAPAPAPAPAPKGVDLVLCLDTSGSMQGLIDAARQKLWSVVSELATAKPMPDLRVALLTYGSPGNGDTGHVVLQSDLTRDLDLISERLFALTTNGGEEFVGRVVRHGLDHLTWAPGDALRIMFVAGNESADQDRVRPFRDQAKLAVEKHVVLNAIYCGGADDDVADGYRQLAALGNGRFANIDHNHGTVAIQTPYDKRLAELSRKMNDTYVAYGEKAEEAHTRQAAQDANAAAAGAPAAAERAKAKAGRLYRNGSWDLVDRMTEEGFDLSKVSDDDLPEAMRGMTLDQKKAWLLAKKAERESFQDQIQTLSEQRDAYVKEQMNEQKLDDSKALDRALRDAIREQAAAEGFEVGKSD